MADKLHAGVLTSFSGGELTPNLAGRVDKEELKIGSRHVTNFIPEHQGGLKKFYGSGHVAKVTDSMTAGYRMIPFDGCGEPLCLLFVPGKVYCVTRSEMYQVSVSISLQMILGASYVQSSDVMYLTNESMGQAVITYAGKDSNGHHVFSAQTQTFVVEPFFPLNWQGNYNGMAITTSASTGTITITGNAQPTVYSIELPTVLKNCGTGKSVTAESDSTAGITYYTGSTHTGPITLGTCTLELHRVRGGVDSVVTGGTVTIGTYTETSATSNDVAVA